MSVLEHDIEHVFDVDLLRRLTQAFGPSGDEEMIREILAEAVRPFCDEVCTDALGNLIAVRHGSGKKIMVAAHMDEIGVMVTYIDENGFIRFTTIGGVAVHELVYRRVQFRSGLIGVIGVEKREKTGEIKLDKLFIDIGACSRAEAEAMVGIGESGVFVGELRLLGSRLIAKALDDRIGCYIAIKALQQAKTVNEISMVFTVQEEVGLRGARTAAYALEPDLAIGVDVTDTGDTPKAHHMAMRLGAGVAIKVFDRSIIAPPKIKEWMARVAGERNITYQWEVLEFGGTDSGAIQLAKGGILSGGISVPARYVHSPSEMLDQGDVVAAVALLRALLEDTSF